ncbi:cytochrome P450 [Streptomonospora halotolerans]|nr:cytochrome P450 [Streptomonospora nanhaiensis]
MEPVELPVRLDPRAADVHGQARLLRGIGPLVQVRLPGDVVVWAVTRHAELQEILTSRDFSRSGHNWRALRDGEVPDDWPMMSNVLLRNMLTADGADHRRMRSLVSRAFTPRRVAGLRPRVEAIVADLLAGLDATGGRADLREAFAFPLPMRVLAELFGIAEEDRPRLVDLVRRGFGSSVMTPEEGAAFYQEIHEVLGTLIEERRAAPADDLASALIAARDGGDRLSDTELVDMLYLFLAAGFETTEGVLVNAVRALLAHPVHLEFLAHGAATWEGVVEEVLRWDTSLFALPFAYALRDVEVGGTALRAGDAVLLCYGAAGRDATWHGSTAERFDPTREQRGHLAFGWGPHHCMGAPLARMEAAIALRELFTAFPDLRLDADPAALEPVPSLMANTVERLPVAFTPRAERARRTREALGEG